MVAMPAVTARRPTFEAAPNLPTITRLNALAPRANARNRNVLEMLRQIRDYNADTSKAVENVITLCNPGYSLSVFAAKRPGEGGEPVEDEEGLRLVEQIATRMFSEYSGAWDELAGEASRFPGLDCAAAMIHLMTVTYGGAAMECELTPGLSDVVDFYPVDPTIIDFQVNAQTNRLEPGLSIYGSFRPLDPVRFRYIPKDPDVNQPGGRSPLLSVIDTVFFQTQFMRELQAIVHMVNMPRLDIKVMSELAMKVIHESLPHLEATGQEDNKKALMDNFLNAIKERVDTLEADDAFVHWDAVETKYTSPGSTAIPVTDVMAAIDTMIVSGVKQLPILLGRNEGATTTHATVQWEVFVRQLGSYQRVSRSLITWALNLFLRIMGRASYVAFEYDEHKTGDQLVEAQTLKARAEAWAFIVSQGWADDDEAAMQVVGHKATGEKAPPIPAVTQPPDADDGNKAARGNEGLLPALPIFTQAAASATKSADTRRMASLPIIRLDMPVPAGASP